MSKVLSFYLFIYLFIYLLGRAYETGVLGNGWVDVT